MKKIIIIVGSLRKDSINLKLANILANKLRNYEVSIEVLNNIPLFNEDIEFPSPDSVTKLRNKIIDSEGIIFVTPEYNHSYSGVLKNTIDWLSRSIDDNTGQVLSQKKAAFCGFSYSISGSTSAQDDLVQLLNLLNMKIMNYPRLTIPGKSLPLENNIEYIDKYINSINEFM